MNIHTAEFVVAPTAKKQGGIKDIAVGRSDVFRVAPADLTIEDGWNVREENDPAYVQHIDDLARSIAEVGVKEPLKVYWKNGKVVVSNGHSRRLAVIRAMEVYGAEIKSVPVILEDRFASDADRVLTLLVSNSGKPLTPFEQAKVFKRLSGFGWSEKEIATKAGISATRVVQLLEAQALPTPILDLVRTGTVAIDLALQTYKAKDEDGDAALTALSGAVETAKAAGKARATKKHLDGADKKPSAAVIVKTVKTVFDKADVDNSDPEGDVKVSLTLTQAEFAALRAALGL